MKKIFFISLLILLQTYLFAATRYWVGGGTNTNWNSSPVTNWAATSGGAGNQSVPGASDDVFFDGAGNSASVISATITVLSFTVVSGYTNTITHNAVVTIAGNVTFVTGYTIAGSSAITISAASTITSGGKTWPNGVTFSNANTKTLSGNWTITGTLTVSAATTLNWTTNEVLSLGGLTMSSTMTGTASITLTGGTWSGIQALQNNLTIAGNVTISSGGVAYNTGTLTYSSGTVTTTSSLLTIAAAVTLNTAGITWNNITLSASSTLTLNSLLSVTGSFTINNAVSPVTFAGTSGFSVASFICNNQAATTITFKNSVTYTITTAFTGFQTRTGAILAFTSDDGTLKAILTLNNGATCNVLASFTRIDASLGRAIWTFNGTVTTCLNINAFNDLKTVSKSFVQ